MRSERGVSLIEASIVLAVMAVLSTIAAPAINGYIDTARQARARTDVTAIAEAIQQFQTDNGEQQFLLLGNNGACGAPPCAPPSRTDGLRVNMLVSDGDIPTLATAVSTSTLWTQVVNGTTVSSMADHLVDNGPIGSTSFRYRNPNDMTVTTPSGTNPDFARASSSGFNAPYAWRGAYLQGPVDSDPWGNRYAANVVFLDPAPGAEITGVPVSVTAANYPRMDVFVLSAGPDEEVDTAVAQDGAVPGDDDFIYVVSANAK